MQEVPEWPCFNVASPASTHQTEEYDGGHAYNYQVMIRAFETLALHDTSLSTRPHHVILPKQLYQMGTKYLNL